MSALLTAGRGRRLRLSILVPWVLSVSASLLVLETMRHGIGYAELAISVLVGAALIAYSVAHPGAAVLGIVLWVPLEVPVLAYLLRLGAPVGVVRHLGYLKEFWAIALLIAAVRTRNSGRPRRFDAVDWLMIGYIGIATAYLLLPFVSAGSFGDQSWTIRLDAWRLDALFAVVFVCARRIEYSPQQIKRLYAAAFAVAVVMGVAAVWEATNGTGFNNFLVNTLNYPAYRAEVLNNPYLDPTQLLASGSLGSSSFARVGSLFNDPLTLGFFMLIPLGLGLERLASSRLRRAAVVATVSAAVGVLLALTISAILGAALAVVLAAGLAIRRRSPGRFRFMLALAVAAVLLAPLAGHSSLKTRVDGIFNGSQDADAQEHVSASTGALTQVIDHPLGRGLGANTSTAVRFGATNGITSEDSYLETGNELGIAAMLCFAAGLVALLRKLRTRAVRHDMYGDLSGGLWVGGAGLALGGLFLQVWYILPVGLVFFALAGAALSVCAPDDPSRESREPARRS